MNDSTNKPITLRIHVISREKIDILAQVCVWTMRNMPINTPTHTSVLEGLLARMPSIVDDSYSQDILN
ncbi:MAG: hypothetical protein ACJ707_05415 [Nitrososphaera sp.]